MTTLNEPADYLFNILTAHPKRNCIDRSAALVHQPTWKFFKCTHAVKLLTVMSLRVDCPG